MDQGGPVRNDATIFSALEQLHEKIEEAIGAAAEHSCVRSVKYFSPMRNTPIVERHQTSCGCWSGPS